jgi:fructosamine-3-kinase
MPVRSPTQRHLSPADVATFAQASFRQGVAECAELDGGGFATVWRVRLDDGRLVVLKVGPPPGTPLLGYERGLIDAEAAYFRLVCDHTDTVPVPAVLHHGGAWLFTSHLPGVPLPNRPPDLDDAPVRRDLGAAIARLHDITGPRFGYSGARPHGPTWRAAFAAMVDDLLADGATWGVTLPRSAASIRDLVARNGAVLDAVDRPALVHFDLWDGNVLAAVDPAGRAHLSGLVDGERHLYGDPLVDLVSPALLRRIEAEPDHPFLRGYTSVRPIVLDGAARRRLTLYRMHLYLLMIVEMPSRAMTGPESQPRRDALARLLVEELSELDRPPH